ncbi:hypothetical protein [Streptomyces fradiae]|uniref:hypothetical protein n=1 Tax=Streptomyces fradiae TaxID=1906 RepID=UPI00099F78D6|nr:hypothetical protein [Streptomyces fradiae]
MQGAEGGPAQLGDVEQPAVHGAVEDEGGRVLGDDVGVAVAVALRLDGDVLAALGGEDGGDPAGAAHADPVAGDQRDEPFPAGRRTGGGTGRAGCGDGGRRGR